MLVHRRSRQVSEANQLAGPGGIVERPNCPVSSISSSPVPGVDFDAGARKTAATELLEETGVRLDEDQIAQMQELPVGDGTFWGAHLHRNYLALLYELPVVKGPEKASRHEVVLNGMNGIGEEAGDGYHAWVSVDELLARTDLMKGCRTPLTYFLENLTAFSAGEVLPPVRPETPVAATAGSIGGVRPAVDAEAESPAPKRMRGSVGSVMPRPVGSVGQAWAARPRTPSAYSLGTWMAAPAVRPAAWSASWSARPQFYQW